MSSLTFVSHASVIIEVDGVSILCDPWLDGKAFNESWALLVPSFSLERDFDRIDYIWVSHEHPDHFHIPTLRALPADFRARTRVLFQANHSEKMAKAFRDQLGFREVISLPHRQKVRLAEGPEVYCYHSRQIDSALAVIGRDETVLDLNDCESSAKDLELIRADLGRIDVLLNQFSVAGFEGVEENLPEAAAGVLSNYVRDTTELGARHTIPFASYIYFCCADNRFLNGHMNTPDMAIAALGEQGAASIVMKPGQTWTIGADWDNAPALDHYREAYCQLDGRAIETGAVIPVERLEAAFLKLAAHVRLRYGALFLSMLKPLTIGVGDLGLTLKLDFRHGRFETGGDAGEPDLLVNSQPLHFALSNPFGVQTLGVSGRYRLLRNRSNWMRHRILFALNNAEIYMRLRYLARPAVMKYFWSRRKGLGEQVIHRLRRMLKATSSEPAPSLSFDD